MTPPVGCVGKEWKMWHTWSWDDQRWPKVNSLRGIMRPSRYCTLSFCETLSWSTRTPRDTPRHNPSHCINLKMCKRFGIFPSSRSITSWGQLNRVDARIVNHREKIASAIEMSCPWFENRCQKDEEKTLKFEPLRWELKAQYKGYKINQYNVIIDVLEARLECGHEKIPQGALRF